MISTTDDLDDKDPGRERRCCERAPNGGNTAQLPDITLVSTTPATTALQRETATIPIVFTNVADPAGSIVAGLDRPARPECGQRK
jgi:hypothetical protein